MPTRFRNREAGGAELAERLAPLRGRKDVIVLGVPTGGIVVALEVARALEAPLAPFVLCQMTVSGDPVHQIGTMASGGVRVIDQQAVASLHLPRRLVDEESELALRELARQEQLANGDQAFPDLRDKTVVVVDDLALTSDTLVSAIRSLRLLGPDSIIAASPIISSVAAVHIAALADRCVAAVIPLQPDEPGNHYEHFPPVALEEVRARLEAARSRYGTGSTRLELERSAHD